MTVEPAEERKKKKKEKKANNRKDTKEIKHAHYENTPIQIYWKFHHQKNSKFSDKNSDIFHISAQNIDCGYLLEPPRQGGSNE